MVPQPYLERRYLAVGSPVNPPNSEQLLLDDAETRGNINADETDELDKTDLILTADGPTAYILAEISITIHQHDIDRAAHRAALLAKATGHSVTPFAIGAQEAPDLNRQRRPDHPHTRTHRPLNPGGPRRTDNALPAVVSSKSSHAPHQGTTHDPPCRTHTQTHHHMESIGSDNAQTFPGNLCPSIAYTIAAAGLRRLG